MDREQLQRAMQQAQKVQLDIVKAQEELSQQELEASSDNGLVHLTMSADGQYKSLKLDPAILKLSHHIIEESILETIGRVNQKASELSRERLLKISKQIGL